MEIITQNITLIAVLSSFAIATGQYIYTKDVFRYILGIILTMYVFGFTMTYQKHIDNPATIKYVIVDYGFVLLCTFLFIHFINKATNEEEI